MAVNPDIRKYHTISWSWTIAFCISLLAYSDAVRIWAVLHSMIFCAAMMVPKLNYFILSRRTVASWVLGIVVLLLTGAEVFQVKNLGDVAGLMLEAITGLLPITLMHREKEVSYWLSLLNTTIIAIGCMLFKGDLVVYILLIGFLSSILFNLNSANMFLLSKGEPEQKEPLPAGFFKQFFATIPVGILSGALIFFAFPRVKSIGMLLTIGEPNNRTGYTGEIDLQGGRQIDQSSALAFIAVAEKRDWLKKEGWNLLFRGTTLASFDGKKWLPPPVEKEAYQNQDLRVNQKHESYTQNLQIFMEPNAEEALFYPGYLFGFTKLPKNVGTVFVDKFANVTRGDSSRTRYAYEIQTFAPDDSNAMAKRPLKELIADTKKNLKSTVLPYQLNEISFATYTQIDEKLKTAEWFSEWYDQVKINPQTTTASEAMRMLKNHFQDNFEASLVNQFSSANSFRSFLTTDKRGHCEYFSTAAVLFFRKIGLPSRIVLGYRGGRYNEVAETLEVREESAHAWVEIFVQGAGWVPYDPTPLGPPTMVVSSSSVIMNYINAAKFWFNRYVIDYDRGTQKDLIESIQSLGYKKGSDQWSALEWFKSVSVPTLGVTAGIIAILFLLRFRKLKKQRSRNPAYYRHYVDCMKKRGFERTLGESLRSFHGRISATKDTSEVHEAVATAIESDLYSPEPNTEEFRKELLVRIKSELRTG